MPNLFNRLFGGRTNTPAETKMSAGQAMLALSQLGPAQWSGRGYASLVNQGFMRNPVVYRCVRLIAETANRVPLLVHVDGKAVSEHPLALLLARPNGRQSGPEMLEAIYAFLQTSGNAYLQAGIVDGAVRTLFVLRPDRMSVVAGRDGWPLAYDYKAGGRAARLSQETLPVPSVLHMALFHPMDDHYGMGPLEAAQTSLDIHNASAHWNKALLDNAARPSGALVYSAGNGQMSEHQFSRLKEELEEQFSGAANAGRPMVLDGGLDWKPLAMSPRDMDFIEARNAAARDIALAFGVPPMLLGIPGDNTYANMAEANRTLWRQTLVPLVVRVTQELSGWLGPAFDGAEVVPDFDKVEALAEDRAALWERVGNAGFLSDAEKRAMVGLGGAMMARFAQRAFNALSGEIRLATLSLKLDVLVALLERRYRPDQPRAPKGTPEGGQWIGSGGTPERPRIRTALAAVLRTQRVGLGDRGLVRHCIYVDALGRQFGRELDAAEFCPQTWPARPYNGPL